MPNSRWFQKDDLQVFPDQGKGFPRPCRRSVDIEIPGHFIFFLDDLNISQKFVKSR